MSTENHTVEIHCRSCYTPFAVTAPLESWIAYWHQGAMIQEAFPYMSLDDRELIVSGICGLCFDTMFGGEE